MQMDETMKTKDAGLDMKSLMHVFSHDLRNPLLNIQALSQEIQLSVVDAQEAKAAKKEETLSQVLTEDLPETLALLQESTQRMDAMISGINEIYHCMYDAVECEAVDMQAMFQRCFASLKLEQENIHLRCSIEAVVYADPWAVKRLLSELLLNAAKAMSVQTDAFPRDITVEVERQGALMMFSVADCGCGLVDTEMERLFEPFFSGSHFEGCVGLGLTRVQALLSKQGGTISMHNTKYGAKVLFSLPIQA